MFDKALRHYKIILVIIMVVGGLLMLMYGSRKPGDYFVDEQWSYTAANSDRGGDYILCFIHGYPLRY
jgi:hypothetical protein